MAAKKTRTADQTTVKDLLDRLDTVGDHIENIRSALSRLPPDQVLHESRAATAGPPPVKPGECPPAPPKRRRHGPRPGPVAKVNPSKDRTAGKRR
jgi:hypothetical protein